MGAKRIFTENVLMLLDDGVHDGLGEHRFVDLVVSVLPVPDQVDDNVLVPGRPPLRGDVGHQHHGLGVVGVDVEDGGVDDPTNVGAVGGGARVPRVCGEPDLVVRHDMNCSLKIALIEINIYIIL